MDIPTNIKLYEHPIATFWFNEEGMLCSVSKNGPRTIKIMEEYISFVKTMVNNQKVCILTDISRASPMDKATRDYSAQKLKEVYKAMAIVSGTPLGKVVGKVFIQLEEQPYPMQLFENIEEAKEWLKQYL